MGLRGWPRPQCFPGHILLWKIPPRYWRNWTPGCELMRPSMQERQRSGGASLSLGHAGPAAAPPGGHLSPEGRQLSSREWTVGQSPIAQLGRGLCLDSCRRESTATEGVKEHRVRGQKAVLAPACLSPEPHNRPAHPSVVASSRGNTKSCAYPRISENNCEAWARPGMKVLGHKACPQFMAGELADEGQNHRD